MMPPNRYVPCTRPGCDACRSSPSDQGSGDVEKMERYLTLRLELLGVERSVVLSLRREGPHQRDTGAGHRTRPRPRGGKAHRFLSVAARFCLRVFEPEADLQRHLEVRNSPLFEMARTDCTSNQSSPRVISAARASPLRIAASMLSGDVPTISITR
jgi:hypothetical protein